MGETSPHSPEDDDDVMDALYSHPTAYIQFAAMGRNIIGMAVCFFNYSTFRAAPFLNVHDLVVLPEYRGLGIGKLLLQGVTLTAIKSKCAKITLEVRNDNEIAAFLYAKMGFKSCTPPMEYLSKELCKTESFIVD